MAQGERRQADADAFCALLSRVSLSDNVANPTLFRQVWRPRHRLRPHLHASKEDQHLDRACRQRIGIKEVDDGIWIVSFMRYDLGYIDLEQRTLQPLDNPFGPRLSPMS